MPWTIPIICDTDEKITGDILLENKSGLLLALFNVEDIYEYDKKEYAQKVYGTIDSTHPGVKKSQSMKKYLAGGKLLLLNEPETLHHKYTLTPMETRVLFKEKKWRTIVGFQTRNVPHLGHEYVQKSALTFVDGLFINPVIGKKKIGDFKDEVILKTYDALINNYYLKDSAVLSIFHTEMRYAGPREAIFHAIVRKNFGCTHFIVGRDHAGVGNFYSPYAAQEIFKEFPDLGIIPLFFKSFYYCQRCESIVNEKICPHDKSDHVNFSGTKIREILEKGDKPSRDLMRPEISEIILQYENPFVEA
jgi:sulfate adenylyltransferase